MSDLTLYHNPRCSKSREALDWLIAQDRAPRVVLYLQNPLTVEELTTLYRQLNLSSPRDMMRIKEELYRELALADPALSDAQLLQAMADHPRLLERPIATLGNEAAIGRPLANIQALVSNQA